MGEPPERPLRIAVVGSGEASPAERALARGVGVALAGAGAVLVCGGLGGVMEEAARGSVEVGGWTLGLLPGTGHADANAWIRIPLPTGMGEARNALVVRGAEAVVAVGGEWGTLSEIALARKMGIPVVTLGKPPAPGLDLPAARDPAEAVEWALREARLRRGTSPSPGHMSGEPGRPASGG